MRDVAAGAAPVAGCGAERTLPVWTSGDAPVGPRGTFPPCLARGHEPAVYYGESASRSEVP